MIIRKYTDKLTKELSRWIKPLLTEEQPETTPERCCFKLTAKELSLVHISPTQNSIELISSNTLFYEDLDSLGIALSAFYRKYSLFDIPTYWLLSPEDYQLFLMDSLPVSAEEFSEALNWRIRSLINFPVEEAIIDSFKLPAKRASTENMIAAVIAKRDFIREIIDILRKVNINLTTIDIPELAMRNLTALYEDDEKSTAFVYLFEHIAILNITRQKNLYFTRRINLFAGNEMENNYKQIGLDLLRYFDYFQSQWRLPAPTRIFVASEKWNATDTAKQLSEYLSLTVEPYQFKSSSIVNTKKTEDITQKNLLVLGCALREGK